MRKLNTCLLGLAVYMSMIPTAHADDNFEFSIQGESGLEFVITGYATDGTQIFRRETSRLEKNNISVPSYIVRVDRSDLERKGFSEWCVQDLTGRWKLLPKGDPEIALCDNKPSETHGGYAFESRRQKIAEPLAAIKKPQDTVGFDDILHVGTGVTKRQEIAIQQGLLHAHDFLKRKVGYEILVPVQAYASTDAGWLADNYLREKRLGKQFRKGKIKEFGCSKMSAEGGYHVMFLCMSSDAWKRNDNSGGNTDAGNMFIVMHEYTHNMQYDLFGEKSRGCCTDGNAMSMFGPQWLMEGSAEYMGYALMADLGLIDLDKRMLEVAHQIQLDDTSLKSRETRKGFRELSNSWDIGPIATHLLISKSGFGALAKFYSDIGKGKKMRPAFLEAFGRSTEQFDKEFKDYIQSSPESTEVYLKNRPVK